MEGEYSECNDLRLKGARHVPLRVTPQMESRGPLGIVNHTVACRPSSMPVASRTLCATAPKTTPERVTRGRRRRRRRTSTVVNKILADAQQRGFRSFETATNTSLSNRTRYARRAARGARRAAVTNQAVCAKVESQVR